LIESLIELSRNQKEEINYSQSEKKRKEYKTKQIDLMVI